MLERDGYLPGVPCWVDTSQPDPEAAVAFYGGLFGWDFEDAVPPGSAGNYFIARLRGGLRRQTEAVMGDRAQRAKGKAEETKGRVKREAGAASGRPSTETRGAAEELKGKTRKAVGKARSAVKKSPADARRPGLRARSLPGTGPGPPGDTTGASTAAAACPSGLPRRGSRSPSTSSRVIAIAAIRSRGNPARVIDLSRERSCGLKLSSDAAIARGSPAIGWVTQSPER